MDTSFKGVNGDGLHNRAHIENKVNMNGLINSYLKVLNECDRAI